MIPIFSQSKPSMWQNKKEKKEKVMIFNPSAYVF
jgi:hypothetical protein